MLYHPEVYWPETLTGAVAAIGRVLRLTYSRHALEASVSDRVLRNIVLPDYIKVSDCEVVEAETDDSGKLSKVVLRTEYRQDSRYHLVLVVIPGRNLVKTVWANRANDTHRSLNRSRYFRG